MVLVLLLPSAGWAILGQRIADERVLGDRSALQLSVAPVSRALSPLSLGVTVSATGEEAREAVTWWECT